MVLYDVYVNKKLFELGLKKSSSNKFCSICKESNNSFIKGDTDIFNSGKLPNIYWDNFPMFELFEVIAFLTTKYNVMFLMENDSISLRIKIKDNIIQIKKVYSDFDFDYIENIIRIVLEEFISKIYEELKK